MKGTSSASRQGSLVCPFCEMGFLCPSDRNTMRCEPCGGRLSGPMLEELRSITALQDVLGSHACECGHPEMRRLPDGIFHCPACGSEVLPIGASPTLSTPNGQGEAYLAGWVDGRFGGRRSFLAERRASARAQFRRTLRYVENAWDTFSR